MGNFYAVTCMLNLISHFFLVLITKINFFETIFWPLGEKRQFFFNFFFDISNFYKSCPFLSRYDLAKISVCLNV